MKKSSSLIGPTTSSAEALFQISGRKAPPQLIRAYLQIKRACAHANWRCGALGSRERSAILRAISRIEDSEIHWHERFPIDRFMAGAGTTLNMNLNEAIAIEAQRDATSPIRLHPNDHVNRSQSTNDTFPTALRVALLQQESTWRNALEALRDSFRARAREFADIPKAGRTHLQDAAPMKLGEQFGSYSRTMEKLLLLSRDAFRGLHEIPLGGTAVGNGVNAPPKFRTAAVSQLRTLTRLTALKSPKNPFEAQASTLDFTVLAQLLALVATELTRIYSDLRLQNSGPRTGLYELAMPELLPGSSIMPGKTNPTGLEMAQQVLLQLSAAQQIAQSAAALGQFELNVWLPALAPVLLESIDMQSRAMHFVDEKVISKISAVIPRLHRHWHDTDQWAVLLAPEWGYEQVAGWVRAAHDADLPVLDWLAREQKIPASSLPNGASAKRRT